MTILQPVLRIRNLTKHYGGVKALTGAEFELKPGEHAAIVGDNGAGKSTFVRLITGAEQPNEGEITLDDKRVMFESPLDAREQGIETVYQTLALAEDLDVPANIFLGREITRLNLGPLSVLNHRAMREKSQEMLSTTGVKIQDMSESLRGMSGGQRQLVSLARLMLRDPAIVFMDEPTATRDQNTEARVILVMREWLRGRTLLMSTHRPQLLEWADLIAVIDSGQCVAWGPKQEMLDKLSRGIDVNTTKPQGAVA